MVSAFQAANHVKFSNNRGKFGSKLGAKFGPKISKKSGAFVLERSALTKLKRVVSKRVVLADVRTLAEESYALRYFWTPKTGTRAHPPKPPFYKTTLFFRKFFSIKGTNLPKGPFCTKTYYGSILLPPWSFTICASTLCSVVLPLQ